MTKRNAIIIAKNNAYLIQYFFNSTEKSRREYRDSQRTPVSFALYICNTYIN